MAEFLYQSLIDWFQEQLTKGTLAAGDKMPSLRSVAKEQGVSLNTAIHGYELLAKDGWIESRPKSGYFVRHRSKMRTAIPILGENYQTLSTLFSLSMRAKMQDQMSLTGQFPPLMQADLFTLTANGQKSTGPGERDTREGVIDYLHLLGIQGNSDSLWLGNSALGMFTQAIQLLTQRQDKVLVITPCDHRLTQTVLSLGRIPVVIASGDHGVDLDLVRKCIEEQKIDLVVLPGQFALPAGQLISNLSLRRCIALLDEMNVLAIEWDMVSYLSYKGKFPMTYKSLDTQGRIFYIGAFEHFDSYGNDVAWSLLGSQFAACKDALFVSNLTPALNVQAALSYGLGKNITRKLNRFTRAIWRKSESIKALLEAEFTDRVSLMPAKGGHFLWLQFDSSLIKALQTLFTDVDAKAGLLLGERVFYEPDAGEWLGVNVSCNEVDKTLLWLIEGVRGFELHQDSMENAVLPEEETPEQALAAPADDIQKDVLQKESDNTTTESSKEKIEPVYNPMLDLINHDFG
ncbi:GntR family transcriptional regulator [Marinomonas algicola]|uniref:GntR family transcriptional regulator n=1 Tax=Marinomonas algicola TaxID=2773454 RepID=UPI00174C0F58|nr:GntR family transcriptional regulator [Marinomonas algicola]